MKIAEELRERYQVEADFDERLLTAAARYMALEEMTLDTLGEPGSTRRAATGYAATADRKLKQLRPRETPRPTAQELLEQARKNGARA